MADASYRPLHRLKPVCEDVWIVDGPLIRYGPGPLRLPFPTRMTIVRLAGDRLFLHSPTQLVPSLRAEVEALGTPRWIVGPNRIHYWWIPDWRDAFPEAEVHLAPRIEEQSRGRVDFPYAPLDPRGPWPWEEAIATLAVSGSYMTEFDFFHRASRTLILTDLIENFERQKLGLAMRWLTRLGGVQHPDGSMPRDMRLTFRGCEAELRAAVETMIGWAPERVILAHGRWYERDGTRELRRAFRWLLR